MTAYTVARRTSEIGIRMALGARRTGVVALVMRAAMVQTAFGVAVGVPAALIRVRYIEAQLYDTKGPDAVTLLASILIMVIAAAVAAWIPARRAASIDPTRALRTE